MSNEFELKGLYRRIDHLLKFSNRATLAALAGVVFCLILYVNTVNSPLEDLRNIWRPGNSLLLLTGCYLLGFGTSYLFVRKLKRIVKSSKITWEQTEEH